MKLTEFFSKIGQEINTNLKSDIRFFFITSNEEEIELELKEVWRDGKKNFVINFEAWNKIDEDFFHKKLTAKE